MRQHVNSRMQSAKDMPSQLTLKERKAGQGTTDELDERDFRAELEAKERKHFKLDKLEDFERAPLSQLSQIINIVACAYAPASSAQRTAKRRPHAVQVCACLVLCPKPIFMLLARTLATCTCLLFVTLRV